MSAIPNLARTAGKDVHWKKIQPFRADDSRRYSEPAKVSSALLCHIAIEQLGRVSNPPDDVRLQRELKEILKECSENDWDGYGANPIDLESVKWVSKFIGLLPDYISYPELSPEPTGELTMVWNKNGFHMIVGINSQGILTYGGTSSSGRIYGDSKFNDESLSIPNGLIEILEMVDGR